MAQSTYNTILSWIKNELNNDFSCLLEDNNGYNEIETLTIEGEN